MSRILRRPSGPDATQRVRLDGREYVLRYRWVQRASTWALDVSDASGTLLIGGVKLVVNFPLLRDVRGARDEVPPGELYVLDPRDPPRPPTLESLGGPTARVVYVTAAELAEGAAA